MINQGERGLARVFLQEVTFVKPLLLSTLGVQAALIARVSHNRRVITASTGREAGKAANLIA